MNSTLSSVFNGIVGLVDHLKLKRARESIALLGQRSRPGFQDLPHDYGFGIFRSFCQLGNFGLHIRIKAQWRGFGLSFVLLGSVLLHGQSA